MEQIGKNQVNANMMGKHMGGMWALWRVREKGKERLDVLTEQNIEKVINLLNISNLANRYHMEHRSNILNYP